MPIGRFTPELFRNSLNCSVSNNSEWHVSALIGNLFSVGMPYVDSTSTRSEVLAALTDNSAWMVESSIDMAKAYVVAANVWLIKFAFDRSKTGPSEQDLTSLNRMTRDGMKQAQDFVNATLASQNCGGPTYLSIANFRGNA